MPYCLFENEGCVVGNNVDAVLACVDLQFEEPKARSEQ